jgi:membrane-associated protease RseP (regulator of RpoE activity)
VTPTTLTPEQQATIQQALGLPAGSTITLEQTQTHDGGTLTIEEEATGEGASLRASGEKVVSDFNATAPGASLTGKGGASGGDTQTINKIAGGGSLWSNPILWVGILSILLGIGTLVVRPPMIPVMIPMRATIILIGAGIGFVIAALYPVLLLFIVAGVVAVLLVPYVQREYTTAREKTEAENGKKVQKTLRSVAASISDFKQAAKDPTNPTISPDSWNRLKGLLESHLEDDEKPIIETIRREDRLA